MPKGSFKGDIGVGIYIDVDMDIATWTTVCKIMGHKWPKRLVVYLPTFRDPGILSRASLRTPDVVWLVKKRSLFGSAFNKDHRKSCIYIRAPDFWKLPYGELPTQFEPSIVKCSKHFGPVLQQERRGMDATKSE